MPYGRGSSRMKPVSYYVGLDVHRQSISYCIKRPEGTIVRDGKVLAQRQTLTEWAQSLGDAPWCGGLEATTCSHWISSAVPVPGRTQNGSSGTARTSVMFKNKSASLLIENGVPYQTCKLYGKKYFTALLQNAEGMNEALHRLLSFSRSQLETLMRIDRTMVALLVNDSLLCDRVRQLHSIEGVGEITALTWALDTGDPGRFPNAKHAISYCGLCSAERESAGVQKRRPISSQRNTFLQSTLIEAAHLAPHFNPTLRAVHEAGLAKGHRHRATVEVARRLVRYLSAIDRQYFQQHSSSQAG